MGRSHNFAEPQDIGAPRCLNGRTLVARRTRALRRLAGALDSIRHRSRAVLRDKAALGKLRLDPPIGPFEAFLERNLRLPPQHPTQLGIVAVAAADTLRFGEIMPSGNTLAGLLGHHVDELIDADKPILTQVQWLLVIGHHEAENALDTV